MKIYEFIDQGITLDASDGSLRKGNGDVVELRPQSREVLRLLAQSPNQTISKAEFSEAVWEGRQVSEDSLVQCIAEIRAALDDGTRTIIQTIPRKGYRFVPPQGAVSKKDRVFRPLVLVTLLAVVVAIFAANQLLWRNQTSGRPEVVAVLPLDDMSAAPHQNYLNDALSEGIISELARFNQFQVIARNSSFQFRSKPTDVREIGKILGAGYVVEGSQQFDGDQVKVTIQLVATDSGAHLFSDQYERQLDDLFAVQNEIARQVASVVGQTVLSDLPVHVAEKDVDSRLRGLQARNLMTQLSRENWEKALALEEVSIREEPDSSWGYIGKSLMLGAGAAMGWREPRADVLEEATELAETALRLGPENYMSHYTLARVLSRRSEHAASILHFQRAADLNPSDSIIWIGMSVPLLYTGETKRALEVLSQAAKVDPLHGDWLRWQQGRAFWQDGDCEAALEAMQSMASPPTASNKTLAIIYACLDRLPEAEAALATFLEANPDHSLEREKSSLPSNWMPEGTADQWIEGLRRAGLQ